MFILQKNVNEYWGRALVSRTTQLRRDALTRALDGTDVHLPDTMKDPRGQLLRILGPPINTC